MVTQSLRNMFNNAQCAQKNRTKPYILKIYIKFRNVRIGQKTPSNKIYQIIF